MTWTQQPALVPAWDQQRGGFHAWEQHDPRTFITYWDTGLTTWDETETSWDTNQVILKLWSKQE